MVLDCEHRGFESISGVDVAAREGWQTPNCLLQGSFVDTETYAGAVYPFDIPVNLARVAGDNFITSMTDSGSDSQFISLQKSPACGKKQFKSHCA